MEKMDGNSMDIVAENVSKLKELFRKLLPMAKLILSHSRPSGNIIVFLARKNSVFDLHRNLSLTLCS